MRPSFGQLKRSELKSMWPTESKDFTPWLADNIQELGKAVGLELELIGTEVPVGEFEVDVLAKDLSTGKNVVIENQFGHTNHDHLGKLLTYASGLDAAGIIWISETLREEHRQALEWLNDRTDEDTLFYGVVLEILRIDESPPAPYFRAVVWPNPFQKSARLPSGAGSKGEAYRAFFQQLIDELREKHKFTGARTAQPQNWFSFASGASGVNYSLVFAQGGRVRAELYISLGSEERSKALFDFLAERAEDIEKQLGSKVQWERLGGKIACRIALYRTGQISEDSAHLADLRDWGVRQLLLFKKVFSPLLEEYRGLEREA